MTLRSFMRAVLLSLLAGCCWGGLLPKVAPGAGPAQGPSVPVTLSIMTYSEEQVGFFQAAAAAFAEAYPGVRLEFITMPKGKYETALPLLLESGQGPDVFYWKYDINPVLTMAELLRRDAIRPLCPTQDAPRAWMQRWPPGAFMNGINLAGGRVYSFPYNDNQMWGLGYMFINRGVFRTAGLDPDRPPQTWHELRSTCAYIKETTGTYCLAVPFDPPAELHRLWMPIAGSIMTDLFFDYQKGRFAIDDPRLVQAFEFIRHLYAEGLIIPRKASKAFARQAFATGQAAIYFGGAWMPSVFEQMGFKDLDLGVAPPPYPEDGPRGALSRRNTENKFWVSRRTAHPDIAWRFIEWMTRPSGFWAREYLQRGFGTLAFAGEDAWPAQPLLRQIFTISRKLRVQYPEPITVNFALSRSQAFLAAVEYRPDWEWEAMLEALFERKDFQAMAREIAAARNRIFFDRLAQEKAHGLPVSSADYAFPGWRFDSDFVLAPEPNPTAPLAR
jgi:multiple sugar transport system substrate-binding protein